MQPGDLVDERYQIEWLLGKGGMGAVFRVHDRTLDKKVAIKTLLPEILMDRRPASQLKKEVRLSQELRQENICATHDFKDHYGDLLQVRTDRALPDINAHIEVRGIALEDSDFGDKFL